MRLPMFIQLLGKWMTLFSTALLAPITVSALYRDGELGYFVLALLVNATLGAVLWLAASKRTVQFETRDGFIVVVGLWLATSVVASIHLALSLGLNLTDAFFEAVSALTTTGATVLTGLDNLPRSVLFFRQELQWLGGIGVVVSALALLPMLAIGGMQLIKAETPGPFKEEKLTPRIAHTAGVLWRLYLAMTVACALTYWFAGMTPFDAIAHSFSTVSTGGFSTHDASFAYFDNAVIEWVAEAFMIFGAISFGAHWLAWRKLSFEHYWLNEEVRAFFGLILLATLIVGATLLFEGTRDSVFQAVRAGSFTVVSVITSTGFGTESFATWPTFLPLFLILVSFIGGCGGSTAGGMKVIRLVILTKVVKLQFFKLVHPHSVRPLKLRGHFLETRDVDGVVAFMIVYLLIFAIFVLAMLAQGMDLVTAFSAVATSINNLGPGLGKGDAELDCLKRIGIHGADALQAFSGDILRRLCMLGLVEPAIRNWMPLEMQYREYRLTGMGKRVLKSLEHFDGNKG
jgi:trk system potassium uptake protein TrkH